MINRSKLYDLIYDKADKLFKKYNPCNIHKENGITVCNRYKNKNELCCVGCEHLGFWGCTVRSLGCKLGQCLDEDYDTIPNIKRFKVFCNKMEKLRRLSWRYGLQSIRMSKEQIFNVTEEIIC